LLRRGGIVGRETTVRREVDTVTEAGMVAEVDTVIGAVTVRGEADMVRTGEIIAITVIQEIGIRDKGVQIMKIDGDDSMAEYLQYIPLLQSRR